MNIERMKIETLFKYQSRLREDRAIEEEKVREAENELFKQWGDFRGDEEDHELHNNEVYLCMYKQNLVRLEMQLNLIDYQIKLKGYHPTTHNRLPWADESSQTNKEGSEQ